MMQGCLMGVWWVCDMEGGTMERQVREGKGGETTTRVFVQRSNARAERCCLVSAVVVPSAPINQQRPS